MTKPAAPATPSTARLAFPAIVLAVAAFVAYFVALHALIASGSMPSIALVLAFAPWAVALFSTLLGPGRPVASRTARHGGALVAAALLVAAAWRYGDLLARRADALVYLENTAFLLLLTTTFAVSLRAGREPLITRLARVARNGDMPPSVVRYTRRVTIAWAVFFAAAAAISTVLFVTVSRTAWSTFVNLAMWPLVGAMFVAEYAVRLWVLRDVQHGSIMRGVHAFRQRAEVGDGAGPSA